MNKKLLTIPALVLALGITSVGLSTKASAMSLDGLFGIGAHAGSTTINANAEGGVRGGPDQNGMSRMAPGVFGTVTAINGNSITLQSKAFTRGSTTSAATTYTVNATNATVTKAGATSSVSSIAVGDTIMVQGTVSGTNVTATKINDGVMPGMMGQAGRGVFGTVTAVNGNTITVQSKAFTKGTTTSAAVTYTVNATNATVTKNNAASAVANIAVGDSVMVEGTVSGTSVTATKINDGVMMKGGPGAMNSSSTPMGNGQPIIGGKVTAVNGNTITITNSSNASYTIDVTNAKITKAGTTASVSNVAVGDEVLAQGTINGNAVTAVTLTDSASTTTTQHKGIFGAIVGFFSHLFGF